MTFRDGYFSVTAALAPRHVRDYIKPRAFFKRQTPTLRRIIIYLTQT